MYNLHASWAYAGILGHWAGTKPKYKALYLKCLIMDKLRVAQLGPLIPLPKPIPITSQRSTILNLITNFVTHEHRKKSQQYFENIITKYIFKMYLSAGTYFIVEWG